MYIPAASDNNSTIKQSLKEGCSQGGLLSRRFSKTVQNLVYTIRGQQVMLDGDLAEIYGYEVKSQFVTSRSATLFHGQEGGRRKLPFALNCRFNDFSIRIRYNESLAIDNRDSGWKKITEVQAYGTNVFAGPAKGDRKTD